MSEFILIKAISTLEGLTFFNDSYIENGKQKYFNITSKIDQSTIDNLENKEYTIYTMAFDKINGKNRVQCIYIAKGTKCIYEQDGEKKFSLKISTKERICNQLLIDNFMSCSEIDLDKDYKSYSYVTIENSPSLREQMDFITFYKEKEELIEPISTYEPIDEEVGLDILAQRNEYCIKDYKNSPLAKRRGEFQRDYERIIHSKAFRRMVDKAQIFSTEKGDHYRTRMTHSIVVSQIAKSISNSLQLNNWLTEAIAFGHDIGHTPFGHQGERTLKEILTGEKKVLKSAIEKGANYGSFKHNYQSLRVATRLEKKYMEYDGLNLSFQTLDGILKHTKINAEEYDIKSFIHSKFAQEYIGGQKFPYTLEGQVVCIADEIAQRSHDLEDAFSAKRLTIDELKKYLLLTKAEQLKVEIEEIENEFKNVKHQNFVKVDDEVLQERISSKIINYFIKDVLKQSRDNIKDYISKGKVANFDANGHRIEEQLICFTEEGKRICDYLEKIISKKVINSAEVCLFDSNGATVVESLFDSYYNNPRLLHRGTLQRIMQDFRNVTRNVVDFEEGDPRVIEKEWKRIINVEPDEVDKDLIENEYLIKNKILVRNITDFIAGMTDSYALNEYNRIKK